MWASLLCVMMQIETLPVMWDLADVGAIRPGGAGARSSARLSSGDDEPPRGDGAVRRAPPHEAARVDAESPRRDGQDAWTNRRTRLARSPVPTSIARGWSVEIPWCLQ